MEARGSWPAKSPLAVKPRSPRSRRRPRPSSSRSRSAAAHRGGDQAQTEAAARGGGERGVAVAVAIGTVAASEEPGMTVTSAGRSTGSGQELQQRGADAQQQGPPAGGGRRHPDHREAVRAGLDHASRLGRAAADRCHPHGLHRPRPGARRRRRAARAHHGDLRAGVVGQDDALPAHPRGGAAGRAASSPSSTWSTRSTPSTPAPAAWMWTTSSSASRTPASRPSRSPRRSSARAASTASSSTPWPRSCRVPRSRARWVTPSWASRRAS